MGKVLTGFWRPGNGGQHWQTGLSIPALKSKDTEM